MFTYKEGVHRSQPHLFVGADVAGQEEIGPLVAALVGKSLDIEREESVIGLLEPAGAAVGPKSECAPRVRAVDAGTVNEGVTPLIGRRGLSGPVFNSREGYRTSVVPVVNPYGCFRIDGDGVAVTNGWRRPATTTADNHNQLTYNCSVSG